MRKPQPANRTQAILMSSELTHLGRGRGTTPAVMPAMGRCTRPPQLAAASAGPTIQMGKATPSPIPAAAAAAMEPSSAISMTHSARPQNSLVTSTQSLSAVVITEIRPMMAPTSDSAHQGDDSLTWV
uniref:Uncharacterized protein n=1 Tax=Arundo donax TaxID=35708 RepID=A0A0A9HBR0_ARUDO